MRILYLNHTLRGRGTYFRAFDIAREMARRGHPATLLTASPGHWYRPTEEMVEGVRVIETPSWNPLVHRDDGWGPLDVAYRMAKVLTEKYDLIYAFAHPPNVYVPARLGSVLMRKPLVVDWCDVYRDGIFPLREEIRAYSGGEGLRMRAQRIAESVEKCLERRIVRKAGAVTVISKDLERAALDEGVAASKILRVPGGANLETFKPMDKKKCREVLLRECGEAARGLEGAEGPFLAYIANYNPDERLFLSALARVFERFPGARLLTTAPAFAKVIVEKTGVEGCLIDLGRQPYERLNTVLGAADVLALPLDDNISNRGRWPNKFGDYLAAGRPVAACAVGDVGEYFAPEEDMRPWLSGESSAESEGLARRIGLASRPNVEAFAEAISELLARPERWDAMGCAARQTAEERLDWRRLSGQIETFLKRVSGLGEVPKNGVGE